MFHQMPIELRTFVLYWVGKGTKLAKRGDETNERAD